MTLSAPLFPASQKLYPLSFRVNADEKARIKSYAGDRSINSYLQDVALKGRSRRRVADVSIKMEMAAKILGALGKSGVLASLERIAVAADMGALPVTDELTDELCNACAFVLAIRHDPIEVLGIEPKS